MKKLVSLFVVLAMLVAISPAVFAEDDFGVGGYTEMVLGENVAVYTAETETSRAQAAYFTWTAEEAGTLTIDFSDEDDGSVWCNVMQTRNGELVSDQNIEEFGGSASVTVEAGDVVTLQVEEYYYKDATLHFTATFAAAVVMEGSGTIEDPWILDSLTDPITGTFTSDEDTDHYYKYVATVAGTLDVDYDNTDCMVVVVLNGNETSSELPTRLEKDDEVIINLWGFFAGSYTATFTFEAAEDEGTEDETESTTHNFDSLVDVNIGTTEDKAEIPAGTTFDDGFFTVVGKVTQRYQESKGGVYAVEIAKNGTGAIEFTVDVTSNVTFVVSSTGKENTSAVELVDAEGWSYFNEEGLSEVSTTTATTLTYLSLPAGTYQLISPESDYNRGFRLMTISVVADDGSQGDWEEDTTVELGDNSFFIDEGGVDSYIFTATEDGTLIITVDAFLVYDPEQETLVETDPSIQLGRMGYYNLLVNGADVNSHVYTIEVVTGQEVEIAISSTSNYAMANVNLAMEGDEAGEDEEGSSDPLSGTLDVTADDPIIVVYTPEADGVLTITLDSTAGWELYINSEYTGSRYDSGATESPVTENVTAGVTYTIEIYGLEEETYFDWIDATITYEVTFTAAGEEGGEDEGGEEGGETAGSLVLGENMLSVGNPEWEPTDAEFTYIAEKDGTLYFTIRSFIMYGQDNIDYLFDPMYGVMQYYCAIYINGNLIEDYDTSVDVVAGDVVTLTLSSIDGGTYELKVQLSNEGFYVPEPGSEEAPLELNFADCDEEGEKSVEFAAGQEIWFQLDYIDWDTYQNGPFYGATLKIYGENAYVAVTVNDMIWGPYTEYYYAEDGVLTFPVNGEIICIGNAGEEAATFELFAYIPLGSESNPDELVIGDNEMTLGESEYFYTFTATETGRLTITITGDDYWFFFINNLTTGKYGDRYYAKDGDENTYTLEVEAGDELQIVFGTLDNDWSSPGGNFVVNAAFEAGLSPATPAVLGDNAMTDGRYEYIAEQDGKLYFCVTTLAWAYGDKSDEIADAYGSNYTLTINGVVMDDFCGYVEVTAGDVVEIKWTSTGYSQFNGTVNLSYEDNNPGLGSQLRPIHLEYADCPASVEIPAGALLWFELSYDFYDAIELTVKGENAYVQYEYYSYEIWDYVTGTVYDEDGDGIIVLSPIPSMSIQIGNAGTEAVTVVIDANIPEGTAGNPADLVLGDNVTEIEAERPDMFYYEWIAPADGTLTINVTGDFWVFYIMNPNTYEQSDAMFYYSDPVVNTVDWAVKAGDRIIVAVSTCIDNSSIDWSDPNLVYPTLPADTIIVSASFVCDVHGETYTDMDYCYGEDSPLFDLVERCIYCDAEMARHLPGTEVNPILVDFLWNDAWTEATATVTVPAGQTLYFGQYRIGSMVLTVDGVEWEVVDGGWFGPCTFVITNEGTEDATYELKLTYPVGSDANPDELPVDQTVTLELPEYNNGYVYQWVATADGTLTVTVSGENWLFFVDNYGPSIEDWADDISGEIHTYVNGDENFVTIEVKAGDIINVRVATQDENWNYPAQTLTVQVEFAAAQDVPPMGDASIFAAAAAALVSAMSIVALPKKKEN